MPVTESTPLKIHSPLASPVCCHFSESDLINLPNARFVVDSGYSGDEFSVYVTGLFTRIFQYLLLQEIIQCRISFRQYKMFGIVYYHRFSYTFTVPDGHSSCISGFSWLEQQILETIRNREGEPVAHLIAKLLDEVIGYEPVISPGKKLIMQIINQQTEPTITLSADRDFLYRKRVAIHLPMAENDVAYEQIIKAIDCEDLINPTFARFSVRIRRIVADALERKTISGD